jgi:hypothetical protein
VPNPTNGHLSRQRLDVDETEKRKVGRPTKWVMSLTIEAPLTPITQPAGTEILNPGVTYESPQSKNCDLEHDSQTRYSNHNSGVALVNNH